MTQLMNTQPTSADDVLQAGVISSNGLVVSRSTATTVTVVPGDAWIPLPVSNPLLGKMPVALSRFNFGPLEQFDTLTTYTDGFSQTAGALNGKTLGSGGGTWATSGAATDFNVGSGVLTRSTISDAAPRFAIADSAVWTDSTVQATLRSTSTGGATGLCARYTDTTHYVAAFVSSLSAPVVYVYKVIGNTLTQDPNSAAFLGGTLLGSFDLRTNNSSAAMSSDESFRLAITADGRWFVGWWSNIVIGSAPTTPTWYFGGQDPDLAQDGRLASGGIGLFDMCNEVFIPSSVRTYDNFSASPSVTTSLTVPVATQTRLDQVVANGLTGKIERLAGTDTAAASLTNRTGAASLPVTSIRLADVLVTSSGVAASNAIQDRRAKALGAVVNGRIITTGGDFTTTSTASWTPIDSPITFETSGEGVLLVNWMGTVSNSGANRCLLTVLLDGVELDTVESTGSNKQSLSGFTLTQPGPGSHTVQLAMKVSSGTGTLTRANGAHFQVVERFTA